MEDDSFRTHKEAFFNALKSLHAEDVLVPISMTKLINIQNTYQEIIHIVRQTKHSCYPVYEDGIDNIAGILHIKDLISCESNLFDLYSLVQHPLFISENKKLDELWLEFCEKQINFAVVVDEYGSVRGIITPNDIFCGLSGISNYNKNQYIIKNDSSFLVDARLSLEEFNTAFQSHCISEEYDTIGGYVIEQLSYVPQIGEVLKLDQIVITVAETEGAKLQKLSVELV